jgi:fatty-acyl-CoA synthase
MADIWEAIAAAQPERLAQIQGDRTSTWAEYDARADALAAHLLAQGVSREAKVAAYLYNTPEFLETYYAAFKAGVAPFNVNYRYGAEEVLYLLDNADAEAVVFHAGFKDLLEEIRPRLPKVRAWVALAEPGHTVPAWATPYDAVVAKTPPVRPVKSAWGRSGEDLLLLYTGGTTGMPKGVMWRHDDLCNVMGPGANLALGLSATKSLPELMERITQPGYARPVRLIACPLMHGTGQFAAFNGLIAGGTAAVLPSRKFDAVELWSEVERIRATVVAIVGLAFSNPMLEALDANPGRWDLSSVKAINSSGSMWSLENKRGLLKHMPGAIILDSLGSSEAVGLAASISAAGSEAQTAAFTLGADCAVFTEEGERIQPGSRERGLVAVAGSLPMGYYKDPEKTAKTFRVIEGRRWSLPGDWAELGADGTLKLLGRGSVCINTGGEKVFPEEVEEALKRHAAVRDAVVVGVPDSRFGERICAVVEAEPGLAPTLPELSAFVREQLADYKSPRELVQVETIGRAPNGKVDYKALRTRALEALGVPA